MTDIRVLIIEDEPEIAGLLQLFLRQSGLTVDHVLDGQEGINRFIEDEQGYDVLIVDGLLPNKNGFEIAQEVRQSSRGNHVGMIMMSAAFRSGSSRREALNSGFDAFFAKPFVVGELLDSTLLLAERRAGKHPPSSARIKAARTEIARAAAARPQEQAAAPKPSPPPKAAPSAPTPVPAAPPAALADPAPSPPAARQARPDPGAAQVPPPRSLSGPEDAPAYLIAVARSGATGVAKLSHGQAQLEIAFLSGVPVGAWDNLRENRFGERLLRRGVLDEHQVAAIDQRMGETRERFAEAAIALGHLDEDQALEAIDGQAEDRLARAVGFDAGDIRFEEDPDAVERAAGTPMDLVAVILRRFLDHPSESLIDRLQHKLDGAAIEPTRDFEPGLVAFAQLRPSSTLPGQFFVGPRQLPEVLVTSQDAGAGVVAMHLAGMLRTPSDPEAHRAIPRHLRLAAGEGEVDSSLGRKVRGALLRARGRDFYAFVGVDRTADKGTIGAALGTLEAELGRDAIDLDRIGPAREAARELWSRMEEAKRTLLNDERRAAYDATLVAPSIDEERSEVSALEALFRQGRVALANKDFAAARSSFETAVQQRPGDVEFQAFFGWATVLDPAHDRAEGMKILAEAQKANPQAVRPLFFLALAAAQEGRKKDALKMLGFAQRIDPGNREVESALTAIKG